MKGIFKLLGLWFFFVLVGCGPGANEFQSAGDIFYYQAKAHPVDNSVGNFECVDNCTQDSFCDFSGATVLQDGSGIKVSWGNCEGSGDGAERFSVQCEASECLVSPQKGGAVILDCDYLNDSENQWIRCEQVVFEEVKK